jgi:excisionase family DNA binding protein
MQNAERVRELEEVAEELRRAGDTRLVQRVHRVIDDLRREETSLADNDLMTTGEAAELLGVRSINTIKRWVADGLLAGYRRGGRVLVTRASVLKMKDVPTVAEQRAFEQRLDAATDPFERGDEDDLSTSGSWEGRRPWAERANGG